VIGEAEAVRRMVQVCAGFQPALAAYEKSEGRLDEGFNVMGELASWAVALSRRGAFQCFDELFDELEALLADADEDAWQVLVIGFIEDLHNMTVRLQDPSSRSDPDVFLTYLGTRTRAEWFRLVNTYLQWGEQWPGRVVDK